MLWDNIKCEIGVSESVYTHHLFDKSIKLFVAQLWLAVWLTSIAFTPSLTSCACEAEWSPNTQEWEDIVHYISIWDKRVFVDSGPAALCAPVPG